MRGHLLMGLLCALLAGDAAAEPAPGGAVTRPARRRVINNVTVAPKPANLIPGLSAQQTARDRIHAIYAADYEDSSFAGRRALARRLIGASLETKRDTDAKFVLLREARDVSAAAGDVTTAFDAIDDLVAAFPVVKLRERVEVMTQSVPVLSSPQANLAAVSICMDLVDQCIVEGDYDRAQMLLDLATTATRAARSVPHAKWIEWRAGTLRPLKEAYDIARPAEIALSRAPGDPQANLVMGRFVAFVKGDFDAGLTMLIKGSDKSLAGLADRDLDNPEKPAEQLKLANDWWDAGTLETDDVRAAMRRRAGFWYARAMPGLDGLDRALAERRLLELNPPKKPGRPTSSLRPPDALKLTARGWYRASIAEVSWETAKQLCEQTGGQLVSIETRVEGELMTRLARGRTLWLGASYDSEQRWTWISGGPFFYSNWASGQPSDLSSDAHPVTTEAGTWRMFKGKAGFICEWTE